jgi:hypothetical protein
MKPQSFVATFVASPYDEIVVTYGETVAHKDRPFYVSFGPVCTWFSIEEIDSLYKQIGLALLAYDSEPS